MRIAVDVRRIRDFGIGTYIRNLLKAFADIAETHEFLLIAGPDDSAHFRDLPPNFKVIVHRSSDMNRVDHLTFAWLIWRLKPDVTHIPLNRVSIFMPRPYVVTVHDLSNVILDKSPLWLRSARRYRFIRGVRRATRVLVVSAATRKDLFNLCPISAERVQLVHNAPDPRFFHSRHDHDSREGDRILERYGVNYPFLLYAGHIRPQKNVPRLVEAFAVARQQLQNDPRYGDLRLIIIGDETSKHPEVRRAVMQSRADHCVRFLGFVPFDTLRVFYERAAAFVFPSLYEGFGLPPLEAMAAGTPVVTSNVGALSEVAGAAAVTVNPENVFDIARGICEILEDELLREEMIRRGRLQAARFSWQRTAADVLRVYLVARR